VTLQHAPEAKCCFYPIQTSIIERDDRHEGRVWPRVINEQNAKSPEVIGQGQTGSIRIVYDTVRFGRGEIDGLKVWDW
jgi:hypothetical protein